MRIWEYICGIEPFTLFIIVFVPVYVIGMRILSKKLRSLAGGRMIWNIMCFIPCITAVLHMYLNGFKGEPIWTYHYYSYLYYGILGSLFLLLFPGRKHIHRLFSSLAVISVILGSAACLANICLINTESRISNFSGKDYVTAFEKTVQQMKENYALSDWKAIDYDAVEAELMPKIKEAQENNDPAAFYSAMNEYVNAFHDGHVTMSAMTITGAEKIQNAMTVSYGHDHGFSMITLTDGRTIAVMTDCDSDAYKKGIRDGTVITRWNGAEIGDAIGSVSCAFFREKFPVAENEDMVKPMFLAGQGGEQITVSFINTGGDEEEITLTSSGNYKNRLQDTLNRFFHDDPKWYCFGDIAPDDMTEEMKAALRITESNFRCEMLNGDCGYIAINSLTYEFPDLNDKLNAMLFCRYPSLIDEIDGKLQDMKEQGMSKLVIDLRNNNGGSASLAAQITSLFTDKELFALSHGRYENGQYKAYGKIISEPNGKWKDLKIAVLVNAKCVSAGDLLCKLLSQCPDAVLIGTTCSNNSCQSTGGICVLPDSEVCIEYPMFIELDENNAPLIDTDSSRTARIPLDVVIPITAESTQIMFNDHTADYELDYAVEYLARER